MNDQNIGYLAHRIELRPTPQQIEYFSKCCGIRRFTYNKMVEHFVVNKNKFTKAKTIDLNKQLRTDFPWMTEVTSRASRVACEDFSVAYDRFFKKLGRIPKFKKKGKSNESFSIREPIKFKVDERTLRIEKLKTPIRMRNKLRMKGIPKHCTISQKAGKWFVSILVEVIELPKPVDYSTREPSVGVDMGIKELAVLSDGTVFNASSALKTKLKKLSKLQKRMSRQVKGSNRRNRTKVKVQKLHYFVSEKRKADLHNLSDYLTTHYSLITIEDLNVKGMVRNRKLSRAISDVGFGELRRQIEYKSLLRGNQVVVADRFFPSSKMCHGCASIHDMPLSNRQMVCSCGVDMDRDWNAAINLDNFGNKTATGWSGSINLHIGVK